MIEQEKNKITILVADSQPEQLENLRVYAGCNAGIQLCGCAQDGATVLELLKSTPAVDVLIMDMILSGVSALEVLQRLPSLSLPTRPHIIMTTCVSSTVVQRKYLEAGADFIVIKPYSISGLFEHAQLLGCSFAEYQRHRVQKKPASLLESFKASSEECGYWYIQEIEQRLVPMERASSMCKELYAAVAELNGVSQSAVESGVRRTIEGMEQHRSKDYLSLREFLGTPSEKSISNSAFLNRLAQLIRSELK